MRLRPRNPRDARRGDPPPGGGAAIEALRLVHGALERWAAGRYAATPETFSLAKYEIGLAIAVAALGLAVFLRRRGAPVFVAAFAAYALLLGHAARFPPTVSDESDYVLLAASIATDLDVRIDDDFLDGTLVEAVGTVPALFEPLVAVYAEGRETEPRYSYRAPLASILMAPGYAVGRDLGLPRPVRWYLMYLPMAACGAAVVAAAERLGLGGLPLLAFAAAPPVVHYATRPYAEIVGAAAVAWAFLLAAEADRRRPFLTGLLLSVAISAHFRFAYAALPLALFAGRRREVWAGLAPGLVAAGAAYALTGGIEVGAGLWNPSVVPRNLAALFVRPATGLLPIAPVTLLVLAGARAPTARPGLGLFAVYAALMAGYRNAHESFPFCRYLVVSLPLLSPAIAAGAARLPRTAAVLSVATAAFGIAAGAVPYLWRVIL